MVVKHKEPTLQSCIYTQRRKCHCIEEEMQQENPTENGFEYSISNKIYIQRISVI